MRKKRFLFLEPSKTGKQHITLIKGYLSSINSNSSIRESFELVFGGARSTIEMLPKEILSRWKCRVIPVMAPERRRLIRKSLLELYVVVKHMFKMRAGDVLFVSCMLPTSLWILENVNKLLRKKGVSIVLHGELEGAVTRNRENALRIGYWSKRWVNARRKSSLINVVVIDDFIKGKLLSEFPDKFSDLNVMVIHHPVIPFESGLIKEKARAKVCFIGYRTKNKGFDIFHEIATKTKNVKFVAIGEGYIEEIPSGRKRSLQGDREYLLEIEKCNGALFPYTSGYTCSLSAAALDALATGVRIYALDRPFFRDLNAYFGEDVAIVSDGIEELREEIAKLTIEKSDRDDEWISKLKCSKYGIKEVGEKFSAIAYWDN